MQLTVRTVLNEAYQRLEANSETALLDAQLLLAHVLGKSRTWVLAHPECLLTSEQSLSSKALLARLYLGEPLPYLLGHWDFYGLEFIVTPDVLIPRPESELIVEKALSWLKLHPGKHVIADVGTGSGCIAVSLAVNHANLHIFASDISFSALQVASLNAHKHKVAKEIDYYQANLLAPVYADFDLVCANLPYIPSTTLKALDVYKHEPVMALDGGFDGLVLIQHLMEQVSQRMSEHSLLLMEIMYTEGEAALGLAQQYFPAAKVKVVPDLAGLDRMLVIELVKED